MDLSPLLPATSCVSVSPPLCLSHSLSPPINSPLSPPHCLPVCLPVFSAISPCLSSRSLSPHLLLTACHCFSHLLPPHHCLCPCLSLSVSSLSPYLSVSVVSVSPSHWRSLGPSLQLLSLSLCRWVLLSGVLVILCCVCSCVGVEEEKAADIDLYHCPNCEKTQGPSVSAIALSVRRRKNCAKLEPVENNERARPVQTGSQTFIRELRSRTFPRSVSQP
uniref:Uncharacterized protein n=1 Tax=Callorhinchus milii TaxID=7868 RepID=A0A4W3GR77_CALMI